MFTRSLPVPEDFETVNNAIKSAGIEPQVEVSMIPQT